MEKRKALLLPCRFSEKPGIHFDKTFAHRPRFNSIRLAIALVIQYKIKIHQYDVTTSYLNRELEEEIYAHPPIALIEMIHIILRTESKDKKLVSNC